MSENIALLIFVCLVIAVVVSVVRNPHDTIPSFTTVILTIFLLLFTIFGWNFITYDVEIGKQYTKKAKDPFRPVVTCEVIGIDDNYVQYLHIEDTFSFTNSSTLREFYHDVKH